MALLTSLQWGDVQGYIGGGEGEGEGEERGTGKEIGRKGSNLAATATWPCSQAFNGEMYKVTWEAGRERERERRGRGGQARR